MPLAMKSMQTTTVPFTYIKPTQMWTFTSHMRDFVTYVTVTASRIYSILSCRFADINLESVDRILHGVPGEQIQ